MSGKEKNKEKKTTPLSCKRTLVGMEGKGKGLWSGKGTQSVLSIKKEEEHRQRRGSILGNGRRNKAPASQGRSGGTRKNQ